MAVQDDRYLPQLWWGAGPSEWSQIEVRRLGCRVLQMTSLWMQAVSRWGTDPGGRQLPSTEGRSQNRKQLRELPGRRVSNGVSG